MTTGWDGVPSPLWRKRLARHVRECVDCGRHTVGLAGQANITVEQALDLWPKLVETGSTLGSPAVAFGGATAGGWLDRFISGARARKLRVDFIALYWYGGDFVTGNAVKQL